MFIISIRLCHIFFSLSSCKLFVLALWVVWVHFLSSRQKQQLMKAILNYKPEIKTVHQARVLLVGPIGAGKSSFFNSINSAFRGNMTSQAIAGTAGGSVTTQVLAQDFLYN